MNLDDEIKKRKQAYNLGSTRYSNNQLNIWTSATIDFFQKNNVVGNEAAQGLLGGEVGHSFSHHLASVYNTHLNKYDQVIDSVYNSGQGGSAAYHHIIDGNHSLWGAIESLQKSNPHDSLFKDVLEASDHLLRDLTTPSGINPLFQLTPETFNTMANTLKPLGITKMYLADILTINAVELLGSGIALGGMILGRKSMGMKKMSELTGAMVLSSIASANVPLLAIAGIGLYMCNKDYNKVSLIHMGKGALITGCVMGVSSLITVPWLGVVAGLGTAILLRNNLNKFEERLNSVINRYRDFSSDFPKIVTEITQNPKKYDLLES